MEKGLRFLKDIFSKEGLTVGWMVYWRHFWRSVLYGGICFIVLVLIFKLTGAARSVSTAYAFSRIFAFFFSILFLSPVGKIIARKRYNKVIAAFIGWAIWWRMLVTSICFVAPLTVIYFFVIYIFSQPAYVPVIYFATIAFIMTAAYLGLVSYGWAMRRAIEKFSGR